MIRQFVRLGLGIIMAAVLLPATVATAAVKDWTDGTGSWNTPANWSGGTVPVNNDLVNIYFTDGVARAVTYNIPAITLGSMNVSLTGPGATNATLSMAANSVTIGTEYVGYDGRGTIDQSGGTNNAGLLDVGVLAGSTGTYNLSGTGALVSNMSEYVGDAGTGVFNQTGGTNAVIAAQDLIVGSQALSIGTYTLSGGSLSTEGFQFIGDFGNGTINQTGGTNTGGILFLGRRTGSSGTYSLSAGQASFSQPFVGGSTSSPGGTGVLTVSGTGVLNVVYSLRVYNSAGTSLNLSGGTINTAGLDFRGVPALFNWTSGKLNLTSSVTWDPAAAPTSAETVTSAAFGAARTLGASQTLMITGDEALGGIGAFALTLNSGSTHNVTGSLTVNPAGSITVNPGSTLTYSTFTQAGGTVNGTLQNQTTFNYQSGLFNGRVVNQGTFSFGASFTAGNGIESDTAMTLAAGQTLTTNGAGLDNRSPFTVAPGSILVATSVANQSEFIVNGSAAATTFTNSTLLHGIGQVTAAVTNAASGDVRIVAGERLRFAGASFTNQGLVEAIGVATSLAEVEFNSPVTNTTANGLIAGSNSLYRFNSGLMNQASFALSIGTNNVLGDVTNSATGNIVVSGGAGVTFYDDIVQNGTFQVSKVGSTSSVAVVLGAFSGSGGSTGGGDIFFEGDLRPGNSPATVTFANNVSFGFGNSLDIELGGTSPGSQFDQVHVTGQLSLGGTLKVNLINLGSGIFVPHSGDSFDILDFNPGSLTGTFSAIQLPTLAGTLAWNTSQLYTTGVLSVVSGVPGDYNNNGAVDAADFVLWRKGGPLQNDATPGVQPGDFDVWRAHFGQPTGSGSVASANATVPEPATLVLLMFAAAGWCLRRRRAA